MTYRPLIAVTMGDAAGIGAEIIMKSLGHAGIHACCRPLVIGDAARLRAAGRIIASALAVRVLPHTEIETTNFENDVVNCIDLGLIPSDLPWGRLSAIAGAAAFRYVETATKLAMAGRIDAICTVAESAHDRRRASPLPSRDTASPPECAHHAMTDRTRMQCRPRE